MPELTAQEWCEFHVICTDKNYINCSSLVFPVVKQLILVTKKCSLSHFVSLPVFSFAFGGPCTHSSSLVMNEPCQCQLPSARLQKAYPIVICIGSKARVTYKNHSYYSFDLETMSITCKYLFWKHYSEEQNLFFPYWLTII